MLKYPVYIGVGVNPETAKKTIEAEANILVAGKYIFDSQDIQSAVVSLQSI